MAPVAGRAPHLAPASTAWPGQPASRVRPDASHLGAAVVAGRLARGSGGLEGLRGSRVVIKERRVLPATLPPGSPRVVAHSPSRKGQVLVLTESGSRGHTCWGDSAGGAVQCN